MERLVALTFPADHPYGHTTIGSMADLDAATLADVRDFFATHYRPNNAVLTIAGDVDTATAFAKAETYFGQLEPGPTPPRPDNKPLGPLTDSPRARGVRRRAGRRRLPDLAAARPGHLRVRRARSGRQHPGARADVPAAPSAGPG